MSVSKFLDSLIMDPPGSALSLEIRKDMAGQLGTENFAQELCTIGLTLPRRSGKSWGVQELFNNYRASYGHDTQYLVVLHNREWRKMWLEQYRERYPYDRDACDCVLTPDMFSRPGSRRLEHSDIVFIEEPRVIGPENLRKIYQHAPANQYVTVGT